MGNKFFMHRIKCANGAYDKGVEVKDTLDDAKQTYHAYLAHTPTAMMQTRILYSA